MDISVSHEGAVAVLRWHAGENRINLDSLQRINSILDGLEDQSGPLALVVTGDGKFFCNGLDLERFGSNPAEFSSTLDEMNRTIGRILVFPTYTVAALNGHTFAGGALLSCAFDQRIMRSDRGYWCMNEAEIGLALDQRLWSILANRLPRDTATFAATTAHRFAGPEALARGIVEELASEEGLLARAIEVAENYATLDRKTLATHKRLIHGDEAELLGFRVS
ncbi:MAG: enoyl-CoA hydratase/isomerase family protein [Acidimicrobiales bacterium]